MPPTWRCSRSARTALRSHCCWRSPSSSCRCSIVLHIWPFGSDYLLRAILIPFLILALAAIGVNILMGYCGQISLGGGAFMAIGAYCAYKFGTGVHLPLDWLGFAISIPPLPVLPSILLGGLMSAFVGILFGIPSLRIKGLYLAVATLAAQFFFDWVFIRVKWFTNYTPSGSVNAPELKFFGCRREHADRALPAVPDCS